MKSTLIFLIVATFLFSSSTISNKEKSNIKISGIEVLDKCIKRYDPNSIWDSFSGKVRIKTIFPEWNNEEYLEINNETDFYQSTLLSTEEKIIKGIEGEECFRMIGDKSILTEEQIEENGLSCDDIEMAKEHHTCHFGFVLNMKKAGLKISDEVSEEKINGWDCYVVSYQGAEEDVIHDYYLGTGKLFIDKSEFVLRGIVRKHPDYPKRVRIINGEIQVNGILMPGVVIYYMGDNKQPIFIDIFYTVEN